MIDFLNTKKYILAAAMGLLLTACGGGSSAPPISPHPKPTVVIEDPAPFAPLAKLLPDIKPTYDLLCGSMTNVQNAVPIDLNKDGRLDLVFNLWCGVSQNGILYTGPVPNTLVAYTQNSDGTWTDSTAAIFGRKIVDIGGVGIRYVLADLNNDGYQDIVYAVNSEDGRLSSDQYNTNQRARNAVVMSKGNGTYSVTNIGQTAWNYGILAVDNELGQKDIVSVPFAEVEAYRFIGNTYTMLSDYNWVTGPDALFFSNSRGASKALLPAGWPEIGVEAWAKTNGTWSKTDTQLFGSQTTVTWISWSRNVDTNKILNLDGKRYISSTISNSCELKLSPTGTMLGAVIMQALEINETEYAKSQDYTKNLFDENGGYYTMVAKLMIYDTTGNKLARVIAPIAGEKNGLNDNEMLCTDVNADGYDDIVITDWRRGTKPVIYINDKKGGFTAVKDSVYTVPEQGFDTFIYVDLDGDGIRDLLHWPIIGIWGITKVQFQIFKGQRHLDSRDTN